VIDTDHSNTVDLKEIKVFLDKYPALFGKDKKFRNQSEPKFKKTFEQRRVYGNFRTT
jgi:hypothetical protein